MVDLAAPGSIASRRLARMSLSADQTQALTEAIRQAHAGRRPLRIAGGDTKRFFGQPVGEVLSTAGHRGILRYHPTELVITARSGTPLAEIEAALAAHNQMLAFEPPAFGVAATLGGTIAAGLSGPRRFSAGAARDFVLGVTCLNGRGELLRFGGEVVKNVAGYDAARLMAGSWGALAVLLDISLKVLPRPETELTVSLTLSPELALEQANRLAGRPLPLTGAAYDGARLWLRLSGSASGVAQARQTIGGDVEPHGNAFWADLKEQRLAFFHDPRPLWRIAMAPAAPPLALAGEWFYDWGGALRWLKTERPAREIHTAVQEGGGHARLFRAGAEAEADAAPMLSPALAQLHRRLKQAFDPHGILNPQRLAADW